MADTKSARNIIIVVVALACVAYAVYTVASGSKEPPTGDADEIRIVCTRCWKEATLTSAQSDAATDEETGLLRCPNCGETAASPISLYCPACKRAIPRSMVVFGSPYVCPFCKESLAPKAPRSDD